MRIARLPACRSLTHDPLVASDVVDHRLDTDNTGLVEVVLRILIAAGAHIGEDLSKATAENPLKIGDDVALSLVGLCNGKDTVPLGSRDICRTIGAVPVVKCLPGPEGIEQFAIGLLILLRYVKGVLRAYGKLVELVEDPVGRHLGRHDSGARSSASVPHEEVVGIEHDLMVLENMAEGLGATDDSALPLCSLVALHIEESPLD